MPVDHETRCQMQDIWRGSLVARRFPVVNSAFISNLTTAIRHHTRIGVNLYFFRSFLQQDGIAAHRPCALTPLICDPGAVTTKSAVIVSPGRTVTDCVGLASLIRANSLIRFITRRASTT